MFEKIGTTLTPACRKDKKTVIVLAICGLFLLFLAPAVALCENSVLVEAENFQVKGGWQIDQQFVDVMGSPYLLAHGLGKPVENAKTEITFPAKGTYSLWVRTKNWVPGKWKSPGRFKVLINGKTVGTTFGVNTGWNWQSGGKVNIKQLKATIELQDLTGFDGRCDAIYFTQDKNNPPPNEFKTMQKWRDKLSGIPDEPNISQKFDVVIIGGGIAGCAAALAAAEEGLNVGLIHDRYLLGGCASEEVRVHTLGLTGTEKSKHIIESINTTHWPHNGDANAIPEGQKRQRTMESAKNVNLFLSWRAFRTNMNGNAIQSVDAKNIETGKIQRFCAPIFIDCTGDGWIGYWAGAEFRYGRESRDKFNEGWKKYGELWSPSEPDKRIMGSSLMWNSENSDHPTTFPDVPWAMPIAKDYVKVEGEWYWEYSDNDINQIDDAEEIRDTLLCAIYGTFANAKKEPNYVNTELKWVGYLLGKRESRRLMGDYIYTMNDAVKGTYLPDTVVEEERAIDVHYQRKLKGEPYIFLSKVMYKKVGKYYIPFRCLYSKNIENLMMAGRCFSCSHIGLGGPRVMNTTGQMGIATGYAAALCKKYNTMPRGIYQEHIKELRNLIGYE